MLRGAFVTASVLGVLTLGLSPLAAQGGLPSTMTLKVETCVPEGLMFVCEFDNGVKVPLSPEDYAKAKAVAAQGGNLTLDAKAGRDQIRSGQVPSQPAPSVAPSQPVRSAPAQPPQTGGYVPGTAQRALESSPEQMAKWTKLMDDLVTLDARGWVFNRYNRGSVRNVEIVEESNDGRQLVAYADYLFNGSRKGHVRVLLVDGNLSCMKYWDSPSCRPVGRSHSQAFAAAAIAGMTDSMLNGSASSGNSGSCRTTGSFTDSVTGATRTITNC